jgi:ribosomal protein RSM22 (predicted rRNA methylase)
VAAELPLALADGVERLLEDVSPRDLGRASADLSAKYREKRERRAPIARSQTEILAYAASRLPATYAAVSAACAAVGDQSADCTTRSLYVLCGGDGTAH